MNNPDMEQFLNVHAHIEKNFMRIWTTGTRIVLEHPHLENTKFGAHVMRLWNIYNIFGSLHSIGVNAWGSEYSHAYYHKYEDVKND